MPYLEVFGFAKHAHCTAVMCSGDVRACGKYLMSVSLKDVLSSTSGTSPIASGTPKQMVRLQEHT